MAVVGELIVGVVGGLGVEVVGRLPKLFSRELMTTHSGTLGPQELTVKLRDFM